tara:strand:- start:175 stop:378 length:204 start_codon:yes stop_codon:yes gene_type:complete
MRGGFLCCWPVFGPVRGPGAGGDFARPVLFDVIYNWNSRQDHAIQGRKAINRSLVMSAKDENGVQAA